MFHFIFEFGNGLLVGLFGVGIYARIFFVLLHYRHTFLIATQKYGHTTLKHNFGGMLKVSGGFQKVTKGGMCFDSGCLVLLPDCKSGKAGVFL